MPEPEVVPEVPIVCANCTASMDAEGDGYTIDGELHCTDCAAVCGECGEVSRYFQATESGAIVCDDCGERCEYCRGTFFRSETWRTVESGAVCESCYRDNYCSCDGCGYAVHHDYMETRGDLSYCSQCAPDEEEEDTVIRSYHSSRRAVRPLPSPFTRAHGGRYFGVELEVERSEGADATRHEIAQRIHDWVNRQAAEITADGHSEEVLHFEEDGSLSNGFEMVSAPMGLDDHARLWRTVLARKMTAGLRSHDTTTCGLHVHVSRQGLTTLQISKTVCFVNDPDNRRLVEAVARRYDTGYCRAFEKKLGTAHKSDGNRYQAVNLCNSHTVEFRIFRGSLRYLSVMAAIEFANAVVSFCGMSSGAGFNLKTAPFLAFLMSPEMRKHTVNLRACIVERMGADGLPEGFRPTNN